jgi:hypothetical protein
VTKGSANVGITGYTADSRTALNLIYNDGTVKTETGRANFTTKDYSGKAALYTYNKGSKVIKEISVIMNAAVPAPTPEKVVAFVGALQYTNKAGKVYTAIVDGAEQEITVDASTAVTADTIYEIETGSDGMTTLTSIAGLVNNGAIKNANGEGLPVATIGTVDAEHFATVAVAATDTDPAIAAVDYYFDSKTVVKDMTGNGTGIEAGALFIAELGKNDSFKDASGNYMNYVKTIYIVG